MPVPEERLIPWHRHGLTGWGLLALGVLAWDLAAADEQMLSQTFRRCKTSPAQTAAVAATWALVTAHLWGVLPKRADPLHMIHVARDNWRQHGLAA